MWPRRERQRVEEFVAAFKNEPTWEQRFREAWEADRNELDTKRTEAKRARARGDRVAEPPATYFVAGEKGTDFLRQVHDALHDVITMPGVTLEDRAQIGQALIRIRELGGWAGPVRQQINFVLDVLEDAKKRTEENARRFHLTPPATLPPSMPPQEERKYGA